jgi:hypothetical protein
MLNVREIEELFYVSIVLNLKYILEQSEYIIIMIYKKRLLNSCLCIEFKEETDTNYSSTQVN